MANRESTVIAYVDPSKARGLYQSNFYEEVKEFCTKYKELINLIVKYNK